MKRGFYRRPFFTHCKQFHLARIRWSAREAARRAIRLGKVHILSSENLGPQVDATADTLTVAYRRTELRGNCQSRSALPGPAYARALEGQRMEAGQTHIENLFYFNTVCRKDHHDVR